jgi:SAM-dependent methyltransferase
MSIDTRDDDNATYICDMELLNSPEGKKFFEMKYSGRLDHLKNYFGERFTEIRLLDVGVGYGMFLKALEELGVKDLHGMDPFVKSMEISRGNTSATLTEGDINDGTWSVEKNSFDAITCLDVVEHLERPAVFFERAKEYLRGDGIIIVTTPNGQLPYRMRSIPLIGFADMNTTHINVHPPKYWRRQALDNGYEILAEWKGEYLTHIRFIPKVLMLLCRILNIDHRRIPVVNSFEQFYGMVIRPIR